MPSKIIIFGQGAAALPQHLAQKGNFGGRLCRPQTPTAQLVLFEQCGAAEHGGHQL